MTVRRTASNVNELERSVTSAYVAAPAPGKDTRKRTAALRIVNPFDNEELLNGITSNRFRAN